MYIGKETETIEFKKSTSLLKVSLNSISAILNKHRKGILYFGVKDSGEVCGMEIGKDTIRDISREISANIRPECYFEVEERTSFDGKNFIEVTFSGDNLPYSSYGKYYMRYADEDKLISDIELERLFRNRSKDYSKWENMDSRVGIDKADFELVKREIDKGYEERRLPFKYESVEHSLSKLGLLTEDKKNLNNAGNVLFSSEKPVLLKLATFATNTKDTFLKLKHFEGNIYECIDEGINFILDSIDFIIVIGETIKRKETPEIPLEALREIILNAFCHGNYDSNTAFEISVFKDRVTIYSPGFFPTGFTPLDFAVKHEEPIMLNPKIAKTLFKTAEVESFGYGFENTFKICEEEKINYSYENTKSGFKFTFYRKSSEKKLYDKLNTTNKEVLEVVRENNYKTIKQISEDLHKSPETVFRSLKKLKELGYIKRVGSDYDGYWAIVN